MRRPLFRLVAVAMLALGMAGTTPAALAGDPCFHDLTRPAPTIGTTTEVALGDCTFGPTITHVAVGAEVVWTNTSIQDHEVAGANLAWGAHGKLLTPGDTIGWTFDTAGVYPYTCMLHPGMSGAVVVGGAAALEAGTLPAAPGAQGTSPSTPAAAPVPPAGDGTPVLVAVSVAAAGLILVAVIGWAGMARRRGAPAE